MWIFGRFLQCSAAGISQKRWGFVPSLGSSKLVHGGLKVESDLQQSLFSSSCNDLIYLASKGLLSLFIVFSSQGKVPSVDLLFVGFLAGVIRINNGRIGRASSKDGEWPTPESPLPSLSRAVFQDLEKSAQKWERERTSAVPLFFVPRFFGNSVCRASRVTYDMKISL